MSTVEITQELICLLTLFSSYQLAILIMCIIHNF